MFPHGHGKLILFIFQIVALVVDLQVVKSEIPLQTSQQNIVRTRFGCFRTKFGNSWIFDSYFIEKLQQNNIASHVSLFLFKIPINLDFGLY